VLFWVGSTLDDLRDFPAGVKRVVGFALRQAQDGGKHVDARPLKGFGGAGVLEIIDDDDGDTYRAVYTIRFSDAVYALHAFKKKSTRGTSTPKCEMDLVRERLKRAEEHHSRWVQEVESDHE
jgi:phage-related protein